jgi:hypothetical protein
MQWSQYFEKGQFDSQNSFEMKEVHTLTVNKVAMEFLNVIDHL